LIDHVPPGDLGNVLSWYARTTGTADAGADNAGAGPGEKDDADTRPNGAEDNDDDEPAGPAGARRKGDVPTSAADPDLTIAL
jgi:hypothetical protein